MKRGEETKDKTIQAFFIRQRAFNCNLLSCHLTARNCVSERKRGGMTGNKKIDGESLEDRRISVTQGFYQNISCICSSDVGGREK